MTGYRHTALATAVAPKHIPTAAIDAAIQYLSKYHHKKQKPIIVGIIDSGVDTTVVDLQDALWKYPLKGKVPLHCP